MSPEALLRVQTRGHGGLALLEFHSLVSLLWVLTTSWSCSPPGSDSVTRALMDPKGETLEGLDWGSSWCRGDTLDGRGL